MTKPIIAITMGDPSGIGPEIIVKALALPTVREFCTPVVVGDLERIRRAAAIVGATVAIRPITTVADARKESGISVLQTGNLPPELPFGIVSREGGDAAYRFIVSAVELAQSRQIDAICKPWFGW